MDHIFYQHIMSSGVRKADPRPCCYCLVTHGPHHARLPCPSLSPGVWRNSCPLSQWCHPTISSSVIPFSSCLQSFPASGSFLMDRFFASGGQSIGASASASVFPMNIQSWFPLGLTGWISLQSKGLSRVFSSTTFRKHWFFRTQPSLWSNSQKYGKTIAFTIWTFVSKMRSLLLNMLSRFVIAFLPRSKPLRSSQTIPGKRLGDNCSKSYRKGLGHTLARLCLLRCPGSLEWWLHIASTWSAPAGCTSGALAVRAAWTLI